MENSQIQIFLQIVLAAFLGALFGAERKYKGKEAGIRTFSLVSTAAAFFTIISFYTADFFSSYASIDFDPTRIIGQIVLGVGFLGAGLIVYRQTHLEGLTTAAAIWLVSAIGVAVGVRLYVLAILVTILGIIIMAGLRIFEEKFFNKKDGNE
jgi:putative Mg2+ transporter-C (MgtC) family protein